MAYLAIARKYRPATFDEIVGQEHVTRTLKNALSSGRIHHAYLFCGARGVGKTTAARALSRSLNCEQGPTATPCGVCTSCVEITNGTAPDLIEIDGASNNSVDDIRDLRETVHYAPTLGRWKIYLIDEVHMLSKAAFNALLKTLEEPPPHVVFIFATTEPNKILDTILSRVQRFDFKRIPVTGVVERLREIATAEGATLSDGALRMIARAGEGSMRDAQSHLDKVISFGGTGEITDQGVAETLGLIDRAILHRMLHGLLHGEPDACLECIDTVYGFGFELSQFTGELLESLRHATLLAMSPKAASFVDLAEEERVTLLGTMDGVPTEHATRIFDALLQVHDQVSRASRPRIVLEMAVARLATKRAVQPLPALLQRLEELERRIRQGKAQGVDAKPRRPREDRTADKPQASQRPQPRPERPERAASPRRSVRGDAPRGPSTTGAQPAPPRPAPAPKAKAAPGPPPRAKVPAPTPKPPTPAPAPKRAPKAATPPAAPQPASPAPKTPDPSAPPAMDEPPPLDDVPAAFDGPPPMDDAPFFGDEPPPYDDVPFFDDAPPMDAPPDGWFDGQAPTPKVDIPSAWPTPAKQVRSYKRPRRERSGRSPSTSGRSATVERGQTRDAWSETRNALRGLGEVAAALLTGTPKQSRDTLVIYLVAGPALARAKKALDVPEVMHTIKRYYPRIQRFEVLPKLGTGSAADQQAALKRQALADPDLRRIADALDATVEYVIPLDDA